MSVTSLRVLLVDDMSVIYTDVVKFFGRIGISAEVKHVMPTDDALPLVGCQLPSGTEFDAFDVALVDLELSNHERGVLYQPEDLAGGTEILPFLRAHAPWLPVIAESRLYEEAAGHFISVAGGFAFDGLWPQSLFRLSKVKIIDQNFWNTTLERAVRVRQESIAGSLPQRERLPTVEVARAVASSFGQGEAAFEDLTRLVFHFGQRVALEPLTPGFSGARVFRAFVREEHATGDANQWVLKVSDSPAKLNQEVRAHTAMMRGGLEFATSVPLLWRGVLVERKLGAIAYKFAPDTTPATDLINDIDRVVRDVAALLRRFYSGAGRSTEHAVLQEVLRRHAPSQAALALARSQFGGSTAELCDAIWSDSDTRLAEVISFTQTRIHGDLHMGNIMLGRSPVFVDFARSGVAPVAVDAAKFASDVIARMPSLHGDSIPSWADDSAVMQVLAPLREVFDLSKSDCALFDRLLRLQLGAMLAYDDLPWDSREWIVTQVNRSD